LINNHIIERDEIYSNALILQVFEDKELKLTFVAHQYDMSYRLTILNYTPTHQECLIYLFKNKLVKSHIPKSTRVKYRVENPDLYWLEFTPKLLLELL